eukprot:4545690-Ditylum_brightwellii.AAC.1
MNLSKSFDNMARQGHGGHKVTPVPIFHAIIIITSRGSIRNAEIQVISLGVYPFSQGDTRCPLKTNQSWRIIQNSTLIIIRHHLHPAGIISKWSSHGTTLT